MSFWDISIFFGFIGIVVIFAMYKSRRERTGEDYFLASRGLMWPIIGLSMIAANISSEQFVGMSGQSAGNVGLAIASYEWMAAIVMVIVCFFLLPKFLKTGIYTMPEFLEYRYTSGARQLMAVFTMVIYVAILVSSVIFAGALTIDVIFGEHIGLKTAVWLVGLVAGIYVIWGGLKAVAWADLFLGSALIIGGAIAMVLGFNEIGFGKFFEENAHKLNMFLPADHPVLPWTALLFGLWIPNFYYWALNQFIVQRTLAAKSLKQGQTGVLFAACLKILTPFVIVIPGIMAGYLYSEQVSTGGDIASDSAFPVLIANLIPKGLTGFMFAAILGAVISSLASMLNSASTIFTMDFFKRVIDRKASEKTIVWTGRISTAIFVVIGCTIAMYLKNFPGGIFTYIQEFQGFISPAVLAVFVVGLVFKRTPKKAGVVALLLNPIIYGLLLIFCGNIKALSTVQIVQIAFLNRMAITFISIVGVMLVMRIAKPLSEPEELPVREEFDMQKTPGLAWIGVGIIVIVLALYVIFSPLVLAK